MHTTIRLLLALGLPSLAALAPAQNCLSTTFAGTTTTTAGNAALFDIVVTNPIRITSIDCNFSATANTAVGLDVWITPNTWVGNHTNQAVWTQVATFPTGTVVAAGPGLPTTFVLANPVVLAPGSYGVALDCDGTSHRYSSAAATNYSDNNIALNLGAIQAQPFTGGLLQPRQWNGTICYQLGNGLFPNFDATPRTGTEPLTVQFTDQTFTSDPNGVLAWSWDVDNDGTPDYTSQNPSHTYVTEGIYSVALSAVDGAHGQVTNTKNAYIEVGTVTASFTTSVLTGTTVLFTDTSTGNPTSWSWDFDNDGNVDATSQNAAFTFPTAGQYISKLTVNDAISNDTITIPIGVGIVPVPPFGSTFSSATATRGFWFQSTTRFSIVSLLVPDETAHGLQNVAVYRLAAAPPVFSANATGGLEFFAAGAPSAQPIPCVVSFDSGEFVGVLGACGDSSTMRNSYGTPAGPFQSSVLGSPITLTRFLTQTNLVTSGGTAAYSQEPNGALSRVVLGVSAAVGLPYGTGTPSGSGAAAPTLRTTALPLLGASATVLTEQQDNGVLGFVLIGLGRSNLATPFGTLYINTILGQIALNGGALLNAGSYPMSLTVPNLPSLNGAGPINLQNLNFVVSSGAFSLSNGQEWWLAN
ncbi:MAG: PKD domain-containing protein [Planctomycetota bacterium]